MFSSANAAHLTTENAPPDKDAKRLGASAAHSAPQRRTLRPKGAGRSRQSRSIRFPMKGKLPLHASPFTRRYFVNGLKPEGRKTPFRLLAIDFVDGLVQNEGSFCTNVTGDVFLRKCCAFDYGKRPARPAKPVDTIPHEGEVSPSCILSDIPLLC